MANYLIQRGNRYYFRIRIPQHYRHAFGGRESIRKSLGILGFNQAKLKAQALSVEFLELFSMAKEPSFKQMTRFYADGSSLKADYGSDEKDIAAIKKAEEQLGINTGQTKAKSSKSITVSEAIEKFCDESQAGGLWTEATYRDIRPALEMFVFVMGDMPVSDLDHDVSREYKELLGKLPSRIKVMPDTKELTSVDEILALKKEPQSVNAVNKYLDHFGKLCNWSIRNGYLNQNPFSGLKLRTKKNEADERYPFTNEDLVAIFSRLPGERLERYWLPVLGFFTGARLGELAQLRVGDIKQSDAGIWYFDINDEDDKSLKTTSSKRKVPIHSFILNDLLELVDGRNTSEFLLPNMKQSTDKRWGKAFSQWFGRYKKKLGLDNKKAFHSFRHTLIERLKDKADMKHIFAIVGHKDTSITTGRYGSGEWSLSKLKETIELI